MKRASIVLFCAIATLFWFSLNTVTPLLTTYAADLGASTAFVGVVAGSYGFFQLFLRIPLGAVSDILYKRKFFIIVSFVMALLSNACLFLFPNKYALLGGRCLSSIAASIWIIYTVLFSSYYKPEDTPKVVGILHTFNCLGSILGQFVGGSMAQLLGTPSAFLLSILLATIGMALSFLIVEKTDKQIKPVALHEIVAVSKNKELLYISALGILMQYIVYAAALSFTPFVAKSLGATSFELGVLSVLSTLPVLFLSPFSGTFFLKIFGAKKSIVLGFALMAVATICVPFCSNLALVYLCQTVSACGRALTFPLLSGLSIKNIEDNKRATAMGIYSSLYSVGMIGGPVIHGLISEHTNMTVAFFTTGLAAVFAICFTVIAGKKIEFHSHTTKANIAAADS